MSSRENEMPKTTGKELSPDEMRELCSDVRDKALEQLCEGLQKVGVPQDQIDKAKAEAIKINSDEPLVALMRNIIKGKK